MNNNKKFYVYIHFKKDTLEPFYIGKGSGTRYKSTKGRSNYWNRVYSKYGFVPDILQYFDNEQLSFEYEKEMIQFFRDQGFVLVNLSNGGEGVSGYKHTEEAKDKIRASHVGMKPSDETRMKLSALAKNRKHSNESKAKMSESRKGRKSKPFSDEHKAKIGAAGKGRIASPETRAKLSASRLGDKHPRFKGAVIATNIVTGEQIRMCGTREMLLAKFDPGSVNACLRGEHKHHKGFTFIRETISPTNTPEQAK